MKKIKASGLRVISILIFIALTLVGLGFKTGTGALCIDPKRLKYLCSPQG
jgi:hypothetical protein